MYWGFKLIQGHDADNLFGIDNIYAYEMRRLIYVIKMDIYHGKKYEFSCGHDAKCHITDETIIHHRSHTVLYHLLP